MKHLFRRPRLSIQTAPKWVNFRKTTALSFHGRPFFVKTEPQQTLKIACPTCTATLAFNPLALLDKNSSMQLPFRTHRSVDRARRMFQGPILAYARPLHNTCQSANNKRATKQVGTQLRQTPSRCAPGKTTARALSACPFARAGKQPIWHQPLPVIMSSPSTLGANSRVVEHSWCCTVWHAILRTH